MEQEESLPEALRRELALLGSVPDAAQGLAVARLEQFRRDWVDYKARRSSTVRRVLVRPPVPRGVYLWGGVGRGKSLLMDCFYRCVPVVRKRRVHFHEFMRSVHHEMGRVAGQADPLDEVGLLIARRYRLICFDEFHVSDIADAMILHRLLKRLFELRVGFVMTSNQAPENLYAGGLHRDRILPAIELLHEHLDVLRLDAGVDYRHRETDRIDTYFVGPAAAGDAHLAEAFERLTGTPAQATTLEIEGRALPARGCAGGVAWFDFAHLCGGPHAHADYLELAGRFPTMLLSGVPRLGPRHASEARRLTWLVDVLYDLRCKLHVAAEVGPDDIFPQGELADEFQRTASRLVEMQSADYAAEPPHPPAPAAV